jgi:hypothetical protein
MDPCEPVIDEHRWVGRFPITGWRLTMDHRHFDPGISDLNPEGGHLLLEAPDGRYVSSGGGVFDDLQAAGTMMVWEPLEVQRDRPVAQHTDLNVHSLSEMLSEPDRGRQTEGAREKCHFETQP